MLLEELAQKAAKPPEYDWESYYRWLFSAVAGREVSGPRFWLCQGCFTTNILLLPEGYGKCRRCNLICMP